MDSTFKFAQGPLPFYDPNDAMFYQEDAEYKQFKAWKAKGAPAGLVVLVLGLAFIAFGSGLL